MKPSEMSGPICPLMVVKRIFFLFIVMVMLLNFVVVVSATVVDTLQCEAVYVGSTKFKLQGDVIHYKGTKIEQGFEYWKKGSDIKQKVAAETTATATFYALISASQQTSYEARTYLIYEDGLHREYTAYSSTVKLTTLKAQTVSLELVNRSSSTAMLTAHVVTNSNQIISVYYRVYSADHGPLADPVNLESGYSTDRDHSIYIEGLNQTTEYAVRVFVVNEDPLTVITSYFHFTTLAIVTPTVSPTPSLTPTPSPSPTPTQSPTPAPTPVPTSKPTPTPTSAQAPTATSKITPSVTPAPTPDLTTNSQPASTEATTTDLTSEMQPLASETAETTLPEVTSETTGATTAEITSTTADDQETKDPGNNLLLLIMLGVIGAALVTIAILLIVRKR